MVAGKLARGLWRRSWLLLVRLGVSHDLLRALEARMVSAYRRELAARAIGAQWQSQQLQALTAQWVCDRAAGWHVAQLAHLALAGLSPSDRAWRALTGALNRLILARQLRDDALDLTTDLNAGRAGWLTHLIAATIWQADGYFCPLDCQRIAGRWLLDVELRQKIARLHATLCVGAADALAPYARALPRLFDLIAAESDAGHAVFAAVPSLHLGATFAPVRDALGTVDTAVERDASPGQCLLAANQYQPAERHGSLRQP